MIDHSGCQRGRGGEGSARSFGSQGDQMAEGYDLFEWMQKKGGGEGGRTRSSEASKAIKRSSDRAIEQSSDQALD